MPYSENERPSVASGGVVDAQPVGDVLHGYVAMAALYGFIETHAVIVHNQPAYYKVGYQ